MKRATGGRRERQTVKNKLSRLQSWKNSGRNRTGSKRAGAVPFFQRKTDKPRVKFRAGRWNTRIVAFLTRSVVVQHRENFFSSIDILLRGELEGKEERRSSRRRFSPPQRKEGKEKPGGKEKEKRTQESFGRDLAIYASGHACFSFSFFQRQEERRGWKRDGWDDSNRKCSSPTVVDTPVYIRTYVEFRCTRISRVNLTPGEKKNFLLPLFFQQRSCSLSPVLSPPSIPLSGSARPSIHTIFTLAFVRLLAFSRPFRRPIRAAQKKGGKREGSL